MESFFFHGGPFEISPATGARTGLRHSIQGYDNTLTINNQEFPLEQVIRMLREHIQLERDLLAFLEKSRPRIVWKEGE